MLLLLLLLMLFLLLIINANNKKITITKDKKNRLNAGVQINCHIVTIKENKNKWTTLGVLGFEIIDLGTF